MHDHIDNSAVGVEAAMISMPMNNYKTICCHLVQVWSVSLPLLYGTSVRALVTTLYA